MSSIRQSYYVYVLARPNGKAFYVGKGKGERVFGHELEAQNGCRCPKCVVIRSIWRQGGQVQRFIVLSTHDEAEALAYEADTIALFGRANLCNRTNGGEGMTGILTRRDPGLPARTRTEPPTKRMASRRANQDALIKQALADPGVRTRVKEEQDASHARRSAAVKAAAAKRKAKSKPQ